MSGAPLAPAAGTADVLVFPAGLAFRGLALGEVPAAVVAALAGDALSQAATAAREGLPGATMFVCCHAARDGEPDAHSALHLRG